MRVLKIFAGVVGSLVAGLAITFVAAKFNDGPLGMIPGGPLRSGEMVTTFTARWDDARDIETIELQLADEETSRTTWIVVDGTKAYIPASLGFPPGKTWHLRADENGRAIIRYNGRRYDVRLDRTSDSEVKATLAGIVRNKYSGGPPSDSEVWFFEITSMSPRSEPSP